jgi:hypothetical protein
MLRYELALWSAGIMTVAGVDEAGMSPLAGLQQAPWCSDLAFGSRVLMTQKARPSDGAACRRDTAPGARLVVRVR